jgi:hypothetical protein
MAPKIARIAITTISVRVKESILFADVGVVHSAMYQATLLMPYLVE